MIIELLLAALNEAVVERVGADDTRERGVGAEVVEMIHSGSGSRL